MSIESDNQTLASALLTAERVARNVIPELAGRPLYIVEPADGTMFTGAMLGWHGGLFYPGLDVALQPQLEAQGRWKGRGVCVVVNAFQCFVYATHDDDGQRAVIGVVLHELAHAFDHCEKLDVPENQYDRFAAACELSAGTTAIMEPSPGNLFSPLLLGHGESFIRLCAHLWYRSSHGGGFVLRPRHLAFGSDYTALPMLHTPQEYIEALWPELKKCQGLPLRALADIDPPPAFTELWNQVLVKFMSAAPDAA